MTSPFSVVDAGHARPQTTSEPYRHPRYAKFALGVALALVALLVVAVLLVVVTHLGQHVAPAGGGG